MSSRKEFEAWLAGFAPTAPESLDDCAWAAWQAATERAAKIANFHKIYQLPGSAQRNVLGNCEKHIREGNE